MILFWKLRWNQYSIHYVKHIIISVFIALNLMNLRMVSVNASKDFLKIIIQVVRNAKKNVINATKMNVLSVKKTFCLLRESAMIAIK